MIIDEQDAADDRLEEEKEIKVKIPVRYHLALHELKVVTGKQISSAVTEAVGDYLDDVVGDDAERGAQEAADETP